MESLFGKKKREPGGTLVLYTTRHGATQRYAERIAQPLDALVKEASYARVDRAKTYDAVVLGCPVYMGRIKGLDFFADHAADLAGKRLVLFTCGLYDPAQQDVRRMLDDQLRGKLGAALDDMIVFHLRGRLRWQNLGLAERLMMKALVAGIRKKAEENRDETEKLLLETEGGALDFSDEADIGAIVHAVRFGREEIV
ncbi:MAG: flavodoxin domain-containing protein [Clostridia bacterium]|nr:flavodoxin domain-containing protein [Clostridia bacterium]